MLWSQDFLSGKLILRYQDHKPSGTCRKSGKPSGFDESTSEPQTTKKQPERLWQAAWWEH